MTTEGNTNAGPLPIMPLAPASSWGPGSAACLCGSVVEMDRAMDCCWTAEDGTTWQVVIIKDRAYTMCWST